MEIPTWVLALYPLLNQEKGLVSQGKSTLGSGRGEGATGKQGGAGGDMAQLQPREVSPGSLNNVTHRQAGTKTTVVTHTHTQHITGGGQAHRLQLGRWALVAALSEDWCWRGRGGGHTSSRLLLGKDLLPKWPVFLSINICI